MIELSLTVPITNSLAFLFTVLGEWWAEGKVITRDTWIGMTFCLIGVALSVHAKNNPWTLTENTDCSVDHTWKVTPAIPWRFCQLFQRRTPTQAKVNRITCNGFRDEFKGLDYFISCLSAFAVPVLDILEANVRAIDIILPLRNRRLKALPPLS
ncbi:hypothetical protein KC362_g71 [Hortaea werneckii]|nr:hypothetical protein KC362_g71 [Hortaea werneckii]